LWLKSSPASPTFPLFPPRKSSRERWERHLRLPLPGLHFVPTQLVYTARKMHRKPFAMFCSIYEMAKSLHKYIRITNVLRSVQPWGRGNVATIVSRANVSMCVCVCLVWDCKCNCNWNRNRNCHGHGHGQIMQLSDSASSHPAHCTRTLVISSASSVCVTMAAPVWDFSHVSGCWWRMRIHG